MADSEARIGFFVFKHNLIIGEIEADDRLHSYWWLYSGKRYRLRPMWDWKPWHEGTPCTDACTHEQANRQVITGYVVCFAGTDRCVAIDIYALVEFSQLARLFHAPLELEEACY